MSKKDIVKNILRDLQHKFDLSDCHIKLIQKDIEVIYI